MLILAFVGVALVSVPLFGGRLDRLADVRFRRTPVLVTALALQLLITLSTRVPEGPSRLLHVVTYLLAGAFLLSNRGVPGLWLITVGTGMNLLAIAANGGIMPASASALATAGRVATGPHFSNSMAVADPNLAFLGDVFALPAPFPLANVFSPGDLLIALGAAVALHGVTGSRLIPSGRGELSALRGHPQFVRVWVAQLVSNLGDWIYALAVAASVASTHGRAHVLAALLVAQVGPAALAGALGGPLVDRLPRKALMIGTDVLRAVAVGSLLLAGPPSLGHLYVVAVCLGLLESLFNPALQASIPNLVPHDRIVAANAAVSATYNIAVMAGPVLGGFLVAGVGPTAAFAVNATSFTVSAVLLTRVKLPHHPGESQGPALGALVQGIRYAVATPLVRGALVAIALVMFASALRSPLEPLFVFTALGEGSRALGLVGGVWGLGMVLGSVAAPAASHRWSRERLLAGAIALAGVCVVAASGMRTLPPVLVLWVIAGFANGVGVVAYGSLLQERTPDRVRGRVMAASTGLMQASLLVGASMAGWFGTHLGVRATYLASGVLFVATAALSRVLLGAGAPVPRTAEAAAEGDPVPVG